MRNASARPHRTARRDPSSSRASAAPNARHSKGAIRCSVAAVRARSRSAPPVRARRKAAGSGSRRQASQSSVAVASVAGQRARAGRSLAPVEPGLWRPCAVVTWGERRFGLVHAVHRDCRIRRPPRGEKARAPAVTKSLQQSGVPAERHRRHGRRPLAAGRHRTVDDMHDEQPPARRDGTRGGRAAEGRARSPMSRRQVMGACRLSPPPARWRGWSPRSSPPSPPPAPPCRARAAAARGSVGASGGVSTNASTGSSGTGASVGASGSVDANGPDGVVTAADTKTAADPRARSLSPVSTSSGTPSVGAALVAGGWAMQHWASRVRKPAVDGPSGGV